MKISKIFEILSYTKICSKILSLISYSFDLYIYFFKNWTDLNFQAILVSTFSNFQFIVFIIIFQVMMAQMTTTMMTRIQSLTCTWVIKWLVHPCFKIVFFIIWTPQLLKWTTMLSFPTWSCFSTSWFAMMFSAMMHTFAH